MTIGSNPARPHASGAHVLDKLLSVLMAAVLAFSLVPSSAWAEDARAASTASAREGTAQPGALSEDAGEEAGAASDPSTGVVGEGLQSGQVEQPEAPSEAVAQEEAFRETSNVVEGEPPAVQETGAPSVEAPASSNAAGEGVLALSLDSDSYVLVQDEQDLDSSYSNVQGELEAGMTLWANVYDSWDDGVPAEPSWTYQWLMGDAKDAGDVDFKPIEGQTSQSIAITEELAVQLAGKYLRVKVMGDGAELFGPSTSWNTPGSYAYNTPGPVLKPGTISLGWAHVVAAESDLEGSASSVTDAKLAHAGDVLHAGAWKSGAAGTLLRSADGVAFSWQMADEGGSFVAVGEGDSFEVPAGSEGKSLRVVADGGGTVQTTGSVKVIDQSAVELYSVSLDAPVSLETGVTLTAHAYAGTWSSKTEVTEGVTFTWKYCEGKAGYGSAWKTVEGATGSALTVDDAYVGCSFIVEATAGANTVELSYYSAVGPFKKAGTYEIYSASYLNDGATSNNFKVGDTMSVQATERIEGSYDHPVIPADKLSVTWLVSSEKNGTYAPLEGESAHKLAFVIPESLEGSYLKCTVNAGSADYTRSAPTNRIAAVDGVVVSRLELNGASADDAVSPGDTLSVSAFDADGNDVTDKLGGWAWHTATTSYGSSETRIEGATGTSFTVPKNDPTFIGKYLVVEVADDYGTVSKATSGKVTVPGSIELYKVEASGSAQVDSTLAATAYKVDQYNASVPVGASDTVLYQWQYATSNTTDDGAFADIPGATGSSFIVPASLPDGTSLVGAYLRVKATSDNDVASTKKPYYGSTLPVDPLGPVTLAGAYELSSVKLASSGQGMQAGNVVTPTARCEKDYLEYDVPADADVTYTWLVSDSENGVFAPIADGVDAEGRLTLDDALVGSWVKVSASALVNMQTSLAYRVVRSGEYDLLRVTLVPSSGTLFTGDTLKATAWARNLVYQQSGDDVTKNVSFSWSVSDSPDGEFVPLAGAQDAELTIPAEAAGKYLKATATCGTSVEAVTDAAIVDSDSLAAAAQKLEGQSFRPNPMYGSATNVNDLVEARLAELGYEGVSVATKTVETNAASEPKAEVGVSSAADETNGEVTFFYVDPDERSTSLGYTTLRTVSLSFELSRDGETFDTAGSYEPSISVPWDDAKAESLLKRKAETLSIAFASGDAADSVTSAFTLPKKVEGASWSDVSWTSSDDSIVKVTGTGFSSDYTGAITRTASDRAVSLTATVSLPAYGGPDVTAVKTFDVTVKGDPQKVAADRAALERKVEAGYAYGSVKDAESGDAVDHEAVTGDLRLPVASALQVDGKYYRVSYAASTDAVEVNGYAGNVFRPLPGAADTPVEITVTVTDKANPEISASKTLSFTVLPLVRSDIDRELDLMEQAKAAYAQAILNGQDADRVAENLHAFQKASFDGSGELAWSYDKDAAEAAGDGIVPVELEGYDDKGAAGWRLFRSSDPGVVAHENLLVSRPRYNASVTVESSLSSEKYARYAERYPDNVEFQKLANQKASAALTVLGSSEQEDSHVTATCTVIGVDVNGAQQTWAAAQPYTLDRGATAADVSEALFAKAGLTAAFSMGAYGWQLDSITSPFDAGVKLSSWDEASGKGWMVYVNGASLNVGAGSYTLQPGDSVIWRYGAWDDPAPTDKLSVTCSVIGVDEDGGAQTWASPATLAMEEGSTAADLSEALFRQAGLEADATTSSYGWFLNSITSPYTGAPLGSQEVLPDVWAFWQLFVNGEFATDGASGIVLKAGDEVTWCYGADSTLPGQVAATCGVIGLNEAGATQVWAPSTSYVMVEGATVADLTQQMFAASGLSFTAGTGSHGWYLDAIASPYTNESLGMAQVDGEWLYWQLFVNGVSSDAYAGELTIKPGDSVVWCYSSYGSSLPDPDDVVIDPKAPRPSYESSWPGFGGGSAGGSVVDSPTPTESVQPAWTYSYGSSQSGASDPIIVNGDLYLVASSELRRIDASTGKVLATANTGGSARFLCRPTYADGVIIVPSDDGSLAAFTADELICVWKTRSLSTEGLSSGYQALSSLTVNNGRVYAAFTAVGAGGVGKAGALVCVSVEDGSVLWTRTTEASDSAPAGYYWAGAAVSGDDIVIGDEAGMVKLFDGATGEVKSSVSVGASCRSGIVEVPSKSRAAGSSTYLATTLDGVLHRIERTGDVLVASGSVSFAQKSTSTPAVAGGKAFVCGMDDGYYGTLSVIDVGSMGVERTVRGGMGEAQSMPLVSVQGDGTYAYFTCNGKPGGVYGYRLGDDAAYALFTPDAAQQEYTVASVIADAQGNLYYVNDSGTLFALKGKPGAQVTFETGGGSYTASRYTALGSALLRPDDPVREGYTFDGWYVDEACTRAWNFADPVTGAMTLFAKWVKKDEGQGGDGGQGGSHGQGGRESGNPETGAVPYAKSWQTGGAPAAAHAPLIRDASAKEKEGLEDAETGQAAKAKGVARSSDADVVAYGADAVSDAQERGGAVNPWAMGGVVLGVVGLVGASAYVLRARRRNGEVS